MLAGMEIKVSASIIKYWKEECGRTNSYIYVHMYISKSSLNWNMIDISACTYTIKHIIHTYVYIISNNYVTSIYVCPRLWLCNNRSEQNIWLTTNCKNLGCMKYLDMPHSACKQESKNVLSAIWTCKVFVEW